MMSTQGNRKRSKLNPFSVPLVFFVLYSALQISGGFCKAIGSIENASMQNKNDSTPTSVKDNSIILSHNRFLRSAGQNEAQHDVQRQSSYSLFPPATTLMKKYAQTRMSKFHGNGNGNNISPSARFLTGGNLNGYRNPVANVLLTRDTPGHGRGRVDTEDEERQIQQGIADGNDGGSLPEQDPTFTPYISARALSNIPNFFDEIRANLHALQMDEDDLPFDESEAEDEDEERENPVIRFGSNVDIASSPLREMLEAVRDNPEQKGIRRWLPASLGSGGIRSRGPNIRHFVQSPSLTESIYRAQSGYNPARNAYEFGLG